MLSIKVPVPLLSIQKIIIERIQQLETKITQIQVIINKASNKKEAILKEFL